MNPGALIGSGVVGIRFLVHIGEPVLSPWCYWSVQRESIWVVVRFEVYNAVTRCRVQLPGVTKGLFPLYSSRCLDGSGSQYSHQMSLAFSAKVIKSLIISVSATVLN